MLLASIRFPDIKVLSQARLTKEVEELKSRSAAREASQGSAAAETETMSTGT